MPAHLRGAAVLCPRCQGRFTAPNEFPTTATAVPTARAVPPPLPSADRKFCVECGATLRRKAVVCPSCGVAQPATSVTSPIPATVPISTNRVAAGIFGILLGCLGIHKFILGYTWEGIIMLMVTMFTFGLGAVVMFVVGVIEGVIYLTKSDAEFHATYEVAHKKWF